MLKKNYSLLYFLIPMLALSSVLRLILLSQESLIISDSALAFLNGVLSDLITAFYFIPVIIIFSLIIPQKVKSKKWMSFLIQTFVLLNIGFWTWTSICEWFFWDEFKTRFNFIAVDYLIYTKEVIGNIRQSFSVEIILGVWLTTTLLISALTLYIYRRNYRPQMTKNWKPLLIILFIAPLYCVDHSPLILSQNNLMNDLSRNGVYEFFSAFRNNELDYEKLYPNIPHQEMITVIEKEFSNEEMKLSKNSKDQLIKVPEKVSGATKNKPNLIIVTVESLGSKFIGSLGNEEHLTPYLDKLSNESIFFTGIYATGTRTVRGLEALSLSLPPTPGASIVRRKKNKNLMTIGSVLNSVGYESKFIYGGHGIFDNMNSFFRKNNYEIVDRTDFSDDEITFSNVWGVADEDLFNKTLLEADKSYNKKTPFFSMVLTTSNHRPFTYPDGRIDIPSHTSRNGAVKYTDYAIGKFLEKAKQKPWFKNTIIVVIADHSTEGRGVIDIPVETYHIPFWIHAPHLLTPKRIDTIASQIDMIPTVLGLMNIDKPNLFFGRNILKMEKSDERFFVGTYQKVGYYSNGVFTSLGPKQVIESYEYDPINKKLGKKIESSENEKKAIGYYQYASFLYKNGIYRIE